MYLEIDEGYFEHPKTMDLCGRMQNALAWAYPIALWKWACRSAKSGQLGAMSNWAIENAVHYEAKDGRCAEALIGAGFIDRCENGTLQIHDWMDYTGGAIKRMEDKAAENRQRREAGRQRFAALQGDHQAASVPEPGDHRTGTVPEPYRNRTSTNPTQTRQDKSSQDKTREDPPLARACDPVATSTEHQAPPAAEAPCAAPAEIAPLRPRTASDLITCLRAAVERAQPQNGFWNPGGRFASDDARGFLEAFTDVEAALPEIESRIEVFAKDPAMAPWTVKKFADKYNDLGPGREPRAEKGGRKIGLPPNWRQQWEKTKAV
jgi:hypothetical protein